MEENLEQYLLANFDQALARSYIRVYYQPVIRTISRQLCSFEALARWVDPVYGVIPPDQFIGTLEQHKKIHLLDREILRQVCERLRMTVNDGGSPIPVSINLSRLDFELVDVFAMVEEHTSRYRIPHNFIHIEITESVAAEQEELLKAVIQRFRQEGYQVWMDDFGSGYSSLNMLKDFELDEVKLDMRFLDSFHQRSRRILNSIIQMAKEIDIHTLAEGVETEDQFLYLRNIGCEKVQGFYFGKPLPYEEALIQLKEKGIEVEAIRERPYFDRLGRINVLSAVPFLEKEEADSTGDAKKLNSIPLCLLEVRGNQFRVFFKNGAFEKMVARMDFGAVFFMEEGERFSPKALIPDRLSRLLDETRNAGEGKLFFISNEEYYEIKTKCVASSRLAYCVLLQINNLSAFWELKRTTQLDKGIRQLYSLFERISLVEIRSEKVSPLYVGIRDNLVSTEGGVESYYKEYCRSWIFREDQEEYREFMDFSTLDSRLDRSNLGYLVRYFRTLTGHGQYAWKEYILLRMRQDVFLELVRETDSGKLDWLKKAYLEKGLRQKESGALEREAFTPELLWENLINSNIVRMFWKDKDRRFLGASRSFLDYYGFDSVEMILGKNDEDLGWHVSPSRYKSDEERVLEEGISTMNEPGKCICRGENRDILASKTPIYDGDGKIVGLLGRFLDKGLLTVHDSRGSETSRRDILTGLLNERGIMEELHMFRDEYLLRGTDFVRIHVAVNGLASINREYGYDFGDKVIRTLGQSLKKSFGVTSAVGRYKGSQFVILHQVSGRKEGYELTSRIHEVATSIQELDGIPVTLYCSVGFALFSEFGDEDEQSQKAEIRLLADQDESHFREQGQSGRAAEIFRLYDDLPIPYGVYRILRGESGKLENARIFYVNHALEAILGRSSQEILGMMVMEYPISESDYAAKELWEDMALRAAYGGESLVKEVLDQSGRRKILMTASQVIRRGYCCFTYQFLDQEG